MADDQGLREYLESLRENRAERERLQDAVSKEVVEAGKAAGYEFTLEDVEQELRRFAVSRGWEG